ncbi:LTA synthase family protein [Achromobacter deleyi]|uniref:LTA synthase family protein n=1 Tax=Achromobacter deleyi TaxID=1353891 RepID=UPI0014915C4F|nr:LTA synthase family protein [Achromobacter deleyi]QVQ28059.1 LTA synthase family protein [Achromobacter deleyi]
MPDAAWSAVAAPLAGGLLATWLLEAGLAPRPRAPWRRPFCAVALHAGVWVFAFACAWAIVGRPYFAAAILLAVFGLIVAVNNAKYHALREPFVWADFEYFTDAIRHPRLYLPFLGIGRALAVAAGVALAVAAGLLLESAARAWTLAAVLGTGGAGLAAWAGSRNVPVSFEARKDLRRLGLVMALWRYARAERQAIGPPVTPFSQAAPAPAAALPDLVAVQSESFFDPRPLYPQLRADLLSGFDQLRAQACAHGRLRVASWGANTVRTEFAFLSGLELREQGVHRYQPYRRLARTGLDTAASYLRGLGYRTVCVHPYHASFYGRDRVLPLLGFDEFIDISAFDGMRGDEPYVGDRAVADLVAAVLRRERSQPVYVHVITMENHGPLHLERVAPADVAAVCAQALPSGCADLVAYCRHLRNADAMFSSLAATLADLPRPAGLCIYGDHVPIMPQVYRQLGAPDGATDYLVWRAGHAGQPVAAEAAATDLARLFLFHMGVMPGA